MVSLNGCNLVITKTISTCFKFLNFSSMLYNFSAVEKNDGKRKRGWG